MHTTRKPSHIKSDSADLFVGFFFLVRHNVPTVTLASHSARKNLEINGCCVWKVGKFSPKAKQRRLEEAVCVTLCFVLSMRRCVMNKFAELKS